MALILFPVVCCNTLLAELLRSFVDESPFIARIENGLKLRPTTRYRAYNNQITKRLIQIMKVTKKVTLK